MDGDNPPVKVLEASAHVWSLLNAFQLFGGSNYEARHRASKELASLDYLDRFPANIRITSHLTLS